MQMGEIGEYFGVSRQRIEQVLRYLSDHHGIDVETTDSVEYWTTRDVCGILGCDSLTVYKHFLDANLVEGEDYYYRTPTSTARRYTYSGVKKLEQQCTHRCKVCDREYRSHKRKTNVCGDEACLRLVNYSHQIPENLRGAMLHIQNACAAVHPDDFCHIGEAIKHTALSRMQIHWLVANNAIPTKPSPHRMWRRQPVNMVSITHLKIAEQIYREHGRIQ